jgi:hypothetical protein
LGISRFVKIHNGDQKISGWSKLPSAFFTVGVQMGMKERTEG